MGWLNGMRSLVECGSLSRAEDETRGLRRNDRRLFCKTRRLQIEE